jgi:hypothetical protein
MSVAWYWDSEDNVWETTLAGLPRRAELDVEPDGRFSELELVYDLAEVEQVLADVARTIRSKCHADSGIFVELSLRREEYLDAISELREAWSKDGVVLEFQGPNRQDFEMDARGMILSHPVDDVRDPRDERPSPGS